MTKKDGLLMMHKGHRFATLSLIGVMALGSYLPATTASASSISTASSSLQKKTIAANYKYAKKMLAKNKTALSGKTSAIFSKSAYPETGAAAGYSDLLLGLRGHGYHFTKTDLSRIKANLVINGKSTPATLSTAIVALKAVGLNPQSFKPAGAKKSVNLVSTLYKQSMTHQTVNVQSQALIALSTSSAYKRPAKAKFSKTSLASTIAKSQLSNNGWAYNNDVKSVDSDTTGVAVIALARSKSSSKTVTSAITKGQSYLRQSVAKNGAYGFSYGGKTYLNANSTAQAITAFSTKLNSLKYVNGAAKSGQSTTALKSMLSYVRSTGSVKGATSQLLGVGQVNLATAAYQKAQQKHSIYTL